MPVTGWICQTSGSARKRITKNTSSFKQGNLDIEGTFDVQGVPGHTHNASAVVSIDANYSRYRDAAIQVPAAVWAVGEIGLPAGMLTDSVPPDNEGERYDRAIERCVGYTALFPENCTGHIREPTRSIGEVRTLVAPKSRLDTLTYVEERGGWRIPNDGDDVKEESTRDVMVSDFPDVYIDVRPLGVQTVQFRAADQAFPGTCFIESGTNQWRVDAAAGGADAVTTEADDDMNLRFVWDDDQKLYKTVQDYVFTLRSVRHVNAQGQVAGDPYDVNPPAVANHRVRLNVRFPAGISTSVAQDGNCWLSALPTGEESLQYSRRALGSIVAPKIPIEVINVDPAEVSDPRNGFKWCGLPAYRIPVGGSVAFPAPDRYSDPFGDGLAQDFTHNFYDELTSFSRGGLLRYARKQQLAEEASAAADAAAAGDVNNADLAQAAVLAATKRSPDALNFSHRATHARGALFRPARTHGNSITGFARSQLAYEHDYPNFTLALHNAFDKGQPNLLLQNLVIAPDIRHLDQTRIAVGGHHSAAFEPRDNFYTKEGSTMISFPTADAADIFVQADHDAHEARTQDRGHGFCSLAATPILLRCNPDGTSDAWDVADAAATLISNYTNGVRSYVPRIIASCAPLAQLADGTMSVELDMRRALADVFQARRITAGGIAAPQNSILSNSYFLRGYSFWLHAQDGAISNFVIGQHGLQAAETAQVMRNVFKDQFGVGNVFAVPYAYAIDEFVYLYDIMLSGEALASAGDRVFFSVDGRMHCGKYVEHTVHYAGQPATGARIAIKLNEIERYDETQQTIVTPNAAALNPMQNVSIHLLDEDLYSSHYGSEPMSSLIADSNRMGAVFNSVKRISQHICAPIVNPNLRIGSTAPLNYDTRHLPPELRDFRLQLQEIDWGRLRSDRVSINELTLYQFRGGVQKVGAEQNVLYLPQFRESMHAITEEFDLQVFSELGCPSYFCIFVRSPNTDILQQPKIRTLSIRNETTKKKSNTITDASVGQLYHLTQRNVNPAAEYDRAAFNRRQTILLSAEDVGLMGLKSSEYQKAKRVNYSFSGTCDRPGNLYILFVYNNRGLHIDGRRLAVVTLHE